MGMNGSKDKEMRGSKGMVSEVNDSEKRMQEHSEGDTVVLGEALQDLQLIRQVVARSQHVMRRAPLVSGLRPVMLLTGLLLLVFSGGKLALELLYGAEEQPAYLHALLHGLLLVGGIGLVILKLTSMLRIVRQDDETLDLLELLREFYTFPISLVAGTGFASLIALPVFLVWAGHTVLVLPVTGLITGALMMALVALLDMRGMLVGAIWMMVSAYACLYLGEDLGVWLVLILVYSLPMILMFLVTTLEGRTRKADHHD